MFMNIDGGLEKNARSVKMFTPAFLGSGIGYYLGIL